MNINRHYSFHCFLSISIVMSSSLLVKFENDCSISSDRSKPAQPVKSFRALLASQSIWCDSGVVRGFGWSSGFYAPVVCESISNRCGRAIEVSPFPLLLKPSTNACHAVALD